MMGPIGGEHAWLMFRLGGPLSAFVEDRKLGFVLGRGGGFLIAGDPDTARTPDIAFVRADRLPHGPPRGFIEGPPDLAVEIVSPGDRASEVLAKVREWLEAGCQVVWVVDPGTRTVQVYWRPHHAEVLTIDDDLRGAEVVPGFKLPLADLFAHQGIEPSR